MILDVISGIGRWMNVVIAFVLVTRLLILRCRRWKFLYTDRDRMNWLAFFGVGVTSGFGSLESIAQGNPPGARTFLVTLTLIAVFWTTMLPLNAERPIQRVHHRDDGSQGSK